MKFKLNASPFARAMLIGCLALSASACHEDHEDALIIPDEPVVNPPTNTAPTVDSTSVDTVEEGSAYSYTIAASDAEDDTLTITASTLPAWLTFDAATGVLTGTPATADVGDHAVTIDVSDGSLSASQSFTITVTAIVVANTAPTITSNAVVTGTVDVAYSYTLTATDVDGDTLDWSSVVLPNWGAFDTSTGILSGTPDLADSYDAEIMVSDGTDAVSQAFTIVVSDAPSSAPTVELLVFENTLLAEWAPWDCCAGSTPSLETDDVDHDQVVEFDVLASAETVQGFTARDADGAIGGTPFDASAFSSTGTLSFEMKVVTAPAAGTPWFLKLESDNAATGTGDYPLNTSNEGLDPVTGEWQTYTFNLADLAAAGLDLGAIDVFMIFPAWGQGAGAVYRVDNVMVLNAAGTPDPVPDPEPTEVVLSVFDNAVQAEWALWDCCAGSTPSVETDDADHGQVAEFDVLASAETVQGFTARDADGAAGGTPFDASAYSSTGTLRFEMKVVTAPAAGTPWFLKLESDNAASGTGDYALNASNEGLDPVTGEWQTYTFNLADLAAAGLDLSAIDVFMIFPAWGQGAGAVYRVDNLNVYADGAAVGSGGSSISGGSLTINVTNGIDFEGIESDQANWEAFENGDPSAALEFVANPSLVGNTSNGVAKLTPLAADPCCGKFAGVVTHTVQSFALSSSNAAVKIWVYKDKISPVGVKFEKFNGDGYGSHGELTATNTLINEWEQLTIDFTSQIGLPETDAITGIAIFPDMVDGRATDTVVYFDELTFGSTGDLPPPPPGEPLTIFADEMNAGWPLWDCCAGSTPTVETDDAEHGAVAEFSVLGSADTVQGFFARDVGTPYVATAAGTLSFEMKVVTAPAAGTPWIVKLEAGGGTSNTGDMDITSSNEGLAPVTGEWQTYTFDVSALEALSLDISAIDTVAVFPAWGQGAGAVYRVDNVQFTVGD
ncbi:MAG: hypothetical protein ACI88A_001355 [Paraglaciecola sp.]|jgi:hypothetical protein